MVGDNYQADVLGALRVGMNAVHVNREKTLKSKSITGMGTNVLTVQTIGDLKNYF
jgi:FMN phosphatase YigB (HAD superfamily)